MVYKWLIHEGKKVPGQLDIYRLKRKLQVRQLTKKDSLVNINIQTPEICTLRHLKVGVPQRAGKAGRGGQRWSADAVWHPPWAQLIQKPEGVGQLLSHNSRGQKQHCSLSDKDGDVVQQCDSYRHSNLPHLHLLQTISPRSGGARGRPQVAAQRVEWAEVSSKLPVQLKWVAT